MVKFIFEFFDKDGDGQLADDEFVRIMKDARARGLNRVCCEGIWGVWGLGNTLSHPSLSLSLQERDLPVGRGFKALLWCIKARMQSDEDA